MLDIFAWSNHNNHQTKQAQFYHIEILCTLLRPAYLVVHSTDLFRGHQNKYKPSFEDLIAL